MTKQKELNPDGVSLMGCTYIYAPRGQAGEYAPLATNPYRGCGHACAYCYVPLVLKMKRPDFDAGAFPRPTSSRTCGKRPRATKLPGSPNR